MERERPELPWWRNTPEAAAIQGAIGSRLQELELLGSHEGDQGRRAILHRLHHLDRQQALREISALRREFNI